MATKAQDSHYTLEDKVRLAPLLQRVRSYFLGRGWVDPKDAARALNMERGTITSKLRELVDANHRALGLCLERKRIGRGIHHYRLSYAEPGQMPLFEAAKEARP